MNDNSKKNNADVETSETKLQNLAFSIIHGAKNILLEDLPKDERNAVLTKFSDTACDELQKIVAIKVKEHESENNSFIANSFDELVNMNLPDLPTIAFHLQRGEMGLLAATTNAGKSTLARNAAITLAVGGAFGDVVQSLDPCKVLLLDFETSLARFRKDLMRMSEGITESERIKLGQNLISVCNAMMPNDEPLTLSNDKHIGIIESQARTHKIDFLIVDTSSAAFALRNENDNAEVAEKALKPLLGLTRRLNCATLLVHHIGKVSENGGFNEVSYLGRGASAFGCYATSMFALINDQNDTNRKTLKCGKRKDGDNYERTLNLNRESRWFSFVAETTATKTPTKTNSQIILQAAGTFENGFKRKELLEAVSEQMKRTTFDNTMKSLIENGHIVKTDYGYFELTNDDEIDENEKLDKAIRF